MKKILLSLVIVIVLVGGGAVYLLMNLDSIAADVIERAGTNAMGSRVSVGDVNIDLRSGRATVRDFRVANPQDFSHNPMIRFDELDVVIELSSLNSEAIHIESISSTNPYVLYEMQEGRTNFDVVRERLARQEPAAEEPTTGAPQRLVIDQVDIEGIQGTLRADRLPRQLDVSLGDVSLRDMEGTPNEIALQIARPLITQVGRNAAAILVEASGEMLEEELSESAEEAARELRREAQSRLEDLGGGAGEQLEEELNEAGRRLGDRLGDLFENR